MWLKNKSAARLGWPEVHRLRCNPERQAATVAKSRFIFGPVTHEVPHLRNMMAAIGVEFVGHVAGDGLFIRAASLTERLRSIHAPTPNGIQGLQCEALLALKAHLAVAKALGILLEGGQFR